VVGLLTIGAGLLGAGSLKDLALALMIGLASGAYSSIFIATPIVADLKEREPVYQQLARRVEARRVREPAAPAAAARPAVGGAQPAATPTVTAVLDGEPDLDGSVPDERPRTAPGPGPRPGARPGGAQQRRNRGGRPGGRGGRPKKRR
jgi:preprotein translocase subunit SecF